MQNVTPYCTHNSPRRDRISGDKPAPCHFFSFVDFEDGLTATTALRCRNRFIHYASPWERPAASMQVNALEDSWRSTPSNATNTARREAPAATRLPHPLSLWKCFSDFVGSCPSYAYKQLHVRAAKLPCCCNSGGLAMWALVQLYNLLACIAGRVTLCKSTQADRQLRVRF